MNILIIDDQASARHILKKILNSIPHITCIEATNITAAIQILAAKQIDIALIDIRLSSDTRNRDGLELIQFIRRSYNTIPIVISCLSEINEIRAAMRNGAYDYIIKDDLSKEMIVPVIEKLISQRALEKEVVHFRNHCQNSMKKNSLIGSSLAMTNLRHLLSRVAASDRPILIHGPTGAGKEVVAEQIHNWGPHPNHPFLAINCSAMPETLIEAQLFGYEKGAFTGAEKKTEGYFQAVRRGTLFLDEIADMPLALQPKLLRVLETNKFQLLGSTQDQCFQGRIVAATHANLEKKVETHTFRADLYYRLNVFVLNVPSLHERKEDIPELITHFLRKQPRKLTFTESAISAFKEARWPGNVRQLKNTIDRIAVLCDDEQITAKTVASFINLKKVSISNVLNEHANSILDLQVANKISAIENAIITCALHKFKGNKSAAARLIGVHRKYIERRQSYSI